MLSTCCLGRESTEKRKGSALVTRCPGELLSTWESICDCRSAAVASCALRASLDSALLRASLLRYEAVGASSRERKLPLFFACAFLGLGDLALMSASRA